MAETSCRHWIGTEDRYCGATPARLYMPGYRCPEHTPAALAGRPEPPDLSAERSETRMNINAAAAQLKTQIRYAAANAPRSLQVEPGPSEIGHPCTQRLARKKLDWTKVNEGGDPMASIDGVAFHAWVAEAFTGASTDDGIEWLVEKRLQIAPGLAGSCDLARHAVKAGILDVFDWKRSSASRIEKYQTEGIPPEYAAQTQLYGYGFEQLGYTVRDVALVFIPRGGQLDDMWIHAAPYDRSKAVAALDRLEAITQALIALDPEQHPERWSYFAMAPSFACNWCPWYAPGTQDLSLGCPSEPSAVNPRTSVESLIA